MVAVGVVVLVALVAGALALVNRHGSGRSVSASGPTQSAPTSASSPVPAKTAARQGSYRPPLDAQGNPIYVAPRALPARNRAIALPAALNVRPTSESVINPTGAEGVVRAAWDLHSQALTSLDVGLMAAFETGPALEVDAGRCECEPGNPFGSIRQLAVSVPRQKAFPAQFFAQVATTASNQDWVAFLVFTRADAGSPWLLDLIGGFQTSDAAVTPPAVDGAGYLMSQTSRPVADPKTVHSLLAGYWREAKQTGSVPPSPVFEPGVWTTDFAQKLSQHHQGGVAENGLIGYYAYQTDTAHDGAYAFDEGQGWKIVCSAVRSQKTFVGTAPDNGPYQDPAQHNWGKSVAPGVYASIVTTEISVPCIEIPAAGSGQKVRVRGAQEYTDVDTAVS